MTTPKQRTAHTLLRTLREQGQPAAAGVAIALAVSGAIQEFLAEVRENRPATESPFPIQKP